MRVYTGCLILVISYTMEEHCIVDDIISYANEYDIMIKDHLNDDRVLSMSLVSSEKGVDASRVIPDLLVNCLELLFTSIYCLLIVL